jgi:hypothetical protein
VSTPDPSLALDALDWRPLYGHWMRATILRRDGLTIYVEKREPRPNHLPEVYWVWVDNAEHPIGTRPNLGHSEVEPIMAQALIYKYAKEDYDHERAA